jgi:inner membrane protein
MDNLTHTLTGFALARSGLSEKTRGATLAVVLASNLPDVDLVTTVFGSTSYLEHHRGISHSIVGAPLLALALAVLLRAVLRGSRFGWLAACALIGAFGHVFLDLWTSYGTRALLPFDRTWYAWDTVFIVDPWVLLILLVGLFLTRRLPHPSQVAAVTLGLVLSYAGARGVLHAQALAQAAARVPTGPSARVAALPDPIDPFRWRVLADSGDAYWTGELNLRGGSQRLRRREKHAEDSVVAQARAGSEVAGIFLDFARFPWLEVEAVPEGTAVIWTDLRYENPVRGAFVTRVVVGRDGTIRSQGFRF